jgi:hypothetical protein
MKRARTAPPPTSHSVLRLVGSELPQPRPELGPLPSKLEGLDSRGRPKHAYLDRIGRMPEAALIDECDRTISASAEATDPTADNALAMPRLLTGGAAAPG